jgi:hypothetical protein
MLYTVDRSKYWDKIVDYFFDHEWKPSTTSVRTLRQWVCNEFNCRESAGDSRILEFTDEASLSWFILRWS